MASTLTPVTDRPPMKVRRSGYVIAIVMNGVMLWAVHQLLDWGWPRFLTDEFADTLPLLSISFIASMIVNICFLYRDGGWFRALADLVTAAVGLAVAVQTWAVFPFDFSDYGHDWSWLIRVGLVAGIVATAVAAVTNDRQLGCARRPPHRPNPGLERRGRRRPRHRRQIGQQPGPLAQLGVGQEPLDDPLVRPLAQHRGPGRIGQRRAPARRRTRRDRSGRAAARPTRRRRSVRRMPPTALAITGRRLYIASLDGQPEPLGQALLGRPRRHDVAGRSR